MTSFDLRKASRPLRPEGYSGALGMQDLGGLLRAHFRRELAVIAGLCFTEIDRAFMLWGAIALLIFSLAQFSSLSWTTQAVLDAALTGAGIASTSGLTWPLATSERLRWVVGLWAVLMMSGMAVTAWGIFAGVAAILTHLCGLWLGLCAFGYGLMALGMRSRAFATASLVHVWAMATLSYQPAWQFLNSGLIMALTLFFFAVVPWDMAASETDSPC